MRDVYQVTPRRSAPGRLKEYNETAKQSREFAALTVASCRLVHRTLTSDAITIACRAVLVNSFPALFSLFSTVLNVGANTEKQCLNAFSGRFLKKSPPQSILTERWPEQREWQI